MVLTTCFFFANNQSDSSDPRSNNRHAAEKKIAQYVDLVEWIIEQHVRIGAFLVSMHV